jgi:hypothetical protein
VIAVARDQRYAFPADPATLHANRDPGERRNPAPGLFVNEHGLVQGKHDAQAVADYW